MPAGLANSGSKRIVACVAVLAAAWLTYAGGKHELASRYAVSQNGSVPPASNRIILNLYPIYIPAQATYSRYMP